MRATLLYGAADVRVEDVADPKIQNPTDAVVRIVLSCICGSDLWPYKSLPPTDNPRHMGHEFLGVVEEIGSAVTGHKPGDVVVAPFVYSDNTCVYCQEGLQTSCAQTPLAAVHAGETLQQLLRFLRSTPSSVNVQPNHFYVLATPEG
ncbi:alcohol dehydrogenase catalytic domain-containing protein, partial [Streptomyces carpinensis]